MSKLWVFIKDTFLKITKSVSFLTMLFMPLIVIGIVIGIIYFAQENFDGVAEVDIAVITDNPGVSEMIEATDEAITVDDEITTEVQAEEQLAAEEIAGYLIVNQDGNTLSASATHDNSLDNHLPLIEQALTSSQILFRAQEIGVTPEEIQSLNEPVIVENKIVSIDEGEIVEEDGLANAIAVGSAYFINIVIMMFITFYASTVIEEVAGEKGTRMMEVILSSTTATTHFFGKIIGVFLVMVLHISVYGAIGTGAYLYFKDHELVTTIMGDLNVGSIILEFLGSAASFLIVGVIMFMFIAAFFGSLITKTEDINRASSPLMMIVLLGFYIGLFAMIQPENIIVVVASFIPLLTPFVMPFRMATNTVSSLQVGLSIGGSVLFTIALAYISLVFYRANVLIYSDTNIWNTLKQSVALIRSENKTSL